MPSPRLVYGFYQREKCATGRGAMTIRGWLLVASVAFAAGVAIAGDERRGYVIERYWPEEKWLMTKLAEGMTRYITLPGPHTNYQHPRCFANGDRNCSATISRDHFISKKYLKQIELNGTTKIAGLAWQEPRTFSLFAHEKVDLEDSMHTP
jgi:hypothetical protein